MQAHKACATEMHGGAQSGRLTPIVEGNVFAACALYLGMRWSAIPLVYMQAHGLIISQREFLLTYPLDSVTMWLSMLLTYDGIISDLVY